VKKRGLYAVRISGLGEGDHNFSFELDREFFGLFEHSEISRGNVKADLILEKNKNVFSLHFSLEGQVEVPCDRCLEEFLLDISARQTIFIKTGETTGEVEDDVLIIGKDDHEIDVGQYMYEFIILALPYQRIHPDDAEGKSACNLEMLNKLNAHRIEGPEGKEETDPRWDVLKGIIEKNK